MGLFKTIGIVGGIAGTLLSASVAFAESNDRVITATATTTRNVKVETAREKNKVKIETAREEAKAKIETSREEAKTRMETKREEAKQKMETAREEAKTRMETKREEVKQRLSDIRDKAKQKLAEKLADQFDNLNKKWTDHFIKQLDHYGAVLLKIQERSDIASTNGKEVTAVSASIKSANTAIDNARTAVVAQASKTYTLDTSSVTTSTATTTSRGQDELMKGLRTQFQSLHKALFNDLKALRDGTMKDARSAVQNALQTLSQIPNVDDDNDSTDDSNQ
ncbi:MAG: hypothetical protein Q8P17_03030 [bacterium]|nr:hypothetical protein [bacterium]